MWSNYHTHTVYCDGKSSITDCLERAIERNVISLGFSSHAPLPFECKWCMKSDMLKSYLNEIEEQRSRFKNIELYKGLEIDYIPGVMSPSLFSRDLDYTIGSIHFVDKFPNGIGWEIDGTLQFFKQGLTQIFKDNIRDAVVRYFELTREMINKSHPDIVGHLDKIKMHNTGNVYYNESEPWYISEIEKTLDVIAKADSILEVNTRGIYQRKTQTVYPSDWILDIALKKNIRITLSSDAHHPDDIINHFPETAAMLLTKGFKTMSVFSQNTWKQYNFSLNGITQ